jgi:hypothetical protein
MTLMEKLRTKERQIEGRKPQLPKRPFRTASIGRILEDLLPQSRYQAVSAQFCEQVEKRILGRLIDVKPKPAALAHVGYDFDRTTKVRISVPR